MGLFHFVMIQQTWHCYFSTRPARISFILCGFFFGWLLEVRRQKAGIHHSKRLLSRIPLLHVNSVNSGFFYNSILNSFKQLITIFWSSLSKNNVFMGFFGSVFVPLVILWSCGMCRSAAECGNMTFQLPLVTCVPVWRAAWTSCVCQVGFLPCRSRIWSSRAGTSHFVQTAGSLLWWWWLVTV